MILEAVVALLMIVNGEIKEAQNFDPNTNKPSMAMCLTR